MMIVTRHEPLRDPAVTHFRLISEPEASAADQQFVRDSLDEFNMVTMNDRNYSPVNIFVRDETGTIAGGILCDLWGSWMHITYLWVADGLRDQGYGTQLMLAAENEAREKGCRGIFLETHSFQAPDFYTRFGFQVVGELKDYPPGHSQFLMSKSLV